MAKEPAFLEPGDVVRLARYPSGDCLVVPLGAIGVVTARGGLQHYTSAQLNVYFPSIGRRHFGVHQDHYEHVGDLAQEAWHAENPGHRQ